MRNTVCPAILVLASLAPHAHARAVRVQGSVWGGNVAGGVWYLRDTPSYDGQPCYYIESSRVNWGWGGCSSTFGGSATRVNNRGNDGQQGSGYTTSGFDDVLTITAPGVPTGTAGTLNAVINISSTYTPNCYFYPDWTHLAGQIIVRVGTTMGGYDLYNWSAYHWPGGLYFDWYRTVPATPVAPSITYSRSFQFGVPFQLSIYGTSQAITEGSPPPEYFEQHLETYVSWGGVTSVTGPGGAVSGYTIVSGSGASYTSGINACTCNGANSPVVDGPHSAKVCPGGQATLTVTPLTPGPLSYQWRKNGSMISGARSAQLIFQVNTAADTGQFDCLVANGCATTQTPAARVSFTDADFNCDGDIGTDADIESFFACLAGSCPPASCGSTADFNGDGDVGTDADIESFFRVLAGGSC